MFNSVSDDTLKVGIDKYEAETMDWLMSWQKPFWLTN